MQREAVIIELEHLRTYLLEDSGGEDSPATEALAYALSAIREHEGCPGLYDYTFDQFICFAKARLKPTSGVVLYVDDLMRAFERWLETVTDRDNWIGSLDQGDRGAFVSDWAKRIYPGIDTSNVDASVSTPPSITGLSITKATHG